jgi:hypothetical protein
MKVFFDVWAEGKKRVQHLDLDGTSFVIRRTSFKHFEDEGKYGRKEWFELCVKGFTQSFNECHDRELKGRIFPKFSNQGKDFWHIIPDMLLDDSN